MFSYIWPLALVIISNTFYQICAKSVPEKMDPFASLTVTYLIGAVISAVLYFALNKDANILQEYKKLNWAPAALGLIVVGLEAGWIYAYKAGWPVSTAQIAQCAALGIVLIFVGTLLYKERLSWNKLLGVGICMVGLAFINLK
ncbi:MAG: EamA family transporter [Clostridiales bacterium]|nr:EamA family transporter [Clostridiales bacterium]